MHDFPRCSESTVWATECAHDWPRKTPNRLILCNRFDRQSFCAHLFVLCDRSIFACFNMHTPKRLLPDHIHRLLISTLTYDTYALHASFSSYSVLYYTCTVCKLRELDILTDTDYRQTGTDVHGLPRSPPTSQGRISYLPRYCTHRPCLS